MGRTRVEKDHAINSEGQAALNTAEMLMEARQGAPMADNEGEQENIGGNATPPAEAQGAPLDTPLNHSGEDIMRMAAALLSAREKQSPEEIAPELESGGPLVLVGAASFLSHGCRFKKGTSESVTDENLYNALLRTGMFQKG